MDEYRRANRANWDDRVAAHTGSREYGIDRYASDPDHISAVVRFDQPRLGDLTGVRGVHLQCHIGTDTVSLARLGARMTGLDFSPAGIAAARCLARDAGADVTFVESDVYAAADVLEPGSYDLVYTSIGALCWLSDVRGWARVVASLLRPGGRLFLRDGHPMMMATGDVRDDGLLVLAYPYFERVDPTRWDDGTTYVETDVVIDHGTSYQWSHGIGETVTAVIDAGLRLTALVEHDSAPWPTYPGQVSEDEHGEWRLTEAPWRLAQTFTLEAVKP
jgi:SAM-dependent methyltransferase